MGYHYRKPDTGYQKSDIDKYPVKPGFQKNRSKNDLFASCYNLYLSGKSLQYIAEIHYKGRFTRQTLYDAFKARGYKMRSKEHGKAIFYDPNGTGGWWFYYDGRSGYRGTINGNRIYLHKFIWENARGPIKKGFYIIHKDGDPANNSIENLLEIRAADAKKMYNHANQNGYRRFPGKGPWGANTP